MNKRILKQSIFRDTSFVPLSDRYFRSAHGDCPCLSSYPGGLSPNPRTGPKNTSWKRTQFDLDLKISSSSTVIWGDSITKHLLSSAGWELFLGDGVLNCGIPGERVEWLFNRVLSHNDLSQVKNHVVLIGTNNCKTNTPQETASTIFSIVTHLRHISPRSSIFILPLLPRYDSHSNGKFVSNVNDCLIELSQDCLLTNVFFSSLPDEINNPSLNYKFFSQDGIHLNSYGSWIFCKWLGKHLLRNSLHSYLPSFIPLHNRFDLLSQDTYDYSSDSFSGEYEGDFPIYPSHASSFLIIDKIRKPNASFQ